MTAFIATALHDTNSVSSIAEWCNVSAVTVNRILDTISFHRPTLSRTISIDEFKGNAGGEKCQCILVAPVKHAVLDILPSRSQAFPTSYFRDIPKRERHRIEFFVCDMWRPYTDLAKTFFPNATVVIDKYHFIRQTTWAIENVRKRLQKTMPANLRKYYKRSRSLILWSREILNAFKYAHITNGPTEGFNNKIKVLKRTSYGIRNFEHLRTRVLLTTH